jgi:endonuclease-3
MRKSDKAARIVDFLDQLYPTTPIPLDHDDAFQLLVAVVLSAQTTDKKVNEISPALFRRGPDAASMAQLEVEEIKALIKQIGLAPSKSRALQGLSEIITTQHAGRVPQTFDELEALPGVGHKTASVVMAQAFGFAAFPVDTHIHRLAARWGLSDGRNVVKTERDLKAVFAEERWNKLHLQIIYFGREHCPARYHDLSACLICAWAATKKRIAEEATMNQPRTRRKSAKR